MSEIAVTVDGEPVETMPIGLIAVLRLGSSLEEYKRDETRIARELLDRGVELVLLLAEGETVEMYDEASMKAAGWVRERDGMAVAEEDGAPERVIEHVNLEYMVLDDGLGLDSGQAH
jgi:hypothetical protein